MEHPYTTIENGERAVEGTDQLPDPAPRADQPGDGPPLPVVLVVEDDPGDRELIRRSFEDCLSQVELRFATSGDEAYDYLFGFGGCDPPRAGKPLLVVLDLDVPGKRGEALLRGVREDPLLHPVPVVILTGSTNEADVRRCYDLGANTYFRKPSTVDGYSKVIRTLESYWLRRAELP